MPYQGLANAAPAHDQHQHWQLFPTVAKPSAFSRTVDYKEATLLRVREAGQMITTASDHDGRAGQAGHMIAS